MATVSLAKFREQAADDMKWVIDRCIFFHLAGGRLYGTSNQDSDYDYVGISSLPDSHILGMRSFENMNLVVEQDGTKHEATFYSLKKFVKLVSACNPNIVESLFVDIGGKNDLCHSLRKAGTLDQAGLWPDYIIKNRRLFLSQKAYHTFCGYATSQMHKLRVKRHNKTGRQEIVAEHGFDTKFAMHAFRLYYEGIELLKWGHITFPRPELSDLRDIRNGLKYKADELDKCITDMEAMGSLMQEAMVRSNLPYSADHEGINQLMIDMYHAERTPELANATGK